MLERIREGSQGPLAMTIVGLIIISFAVTGVGSYLGSSTSEAAAVVNGEDITVQEVEVAYQNQRARMEQQFGEQIASAFANETYLANFKSQVLEQLISEKLVEQKANEMGLRVSDEQIKEAIFDIDAFKIAGQFDNDTFKAILQRQGFTAVSFRDYMRQQMTTEQLSTALTASSFSLEDEVAEVLKLQQQKRDAQTLEVNAADFAGDIELSDEEINDYYQANLSNFDTQEEVKLAYVSLSVEDLMANESVTEEEARQNYQDNIAAYQTIEERRVSHILIEFGDDEAAAESKAEAVLAMVNEADADFATIAAAESADIVSAEEGGDLDYIVKGDWSESFEEAVFGLEKVGDTTGLVKTEFGFHIIKLTDLKPQVTTPFEEVQEELTALLLKDKATDTFFSLQEEIASAAFESPDSLEEVSNISGRPIIQTAFFSSGNYPASVNYPQVENVAFSSELIDDKVNSDILQVNDEKILVVRVAEHKPQRTLALEEVKASITTQLSAEKTQQAALDWTEALKQKLLNGESVYDTLAAKSLEWNEVSGIERFASSLPSEMTKSIFSLAPAAGQDVDVVSLANGNVGLVKLTAVEAVDEIKAEDIEATLQGLANNNSRQSYDSFVAALVDEATIERITR
ncbi:SurA N-terminal domain-containing protein [Glaciecola sp. MH2013]|uniref:SurA N-terminal domain-containing protein n=1 Tax=Glaciecola sp. MH2013 TaxID=2785524 RepID=UPI00189F1531|nr:SurA N-terminal domain-containing protein [Glaciecola sp. MH2013]MBF7074754.1 SurA N-terminal domain-containing protein [Glaciecola sp. MH2013]